MEQFVLPFKEDKIVLKDKIILPIMTHFATPNHNMTLLQTKFLRFVNPKTSVIQSIAGSPPFKRMILLTTITIGMQFPTTATTAENLHALNLIQMIPLICVRPFNLSK